MYFLDRPRPVRAGEALDLAALERWLAGALGLLGPLEVEQFPSGHSNLTYLVRARAGGGGGACWDDTIPQ